MASPVTAYSALINAAPIPCVLVGGDERLIAINPAAEALFGTGLVSRHFVAALRQPALFECLDKVLAGRADTAETRFNTSEGSREITFAVTAARVLHETEPAVLVSFVDTTDLQEAGQMRRDFVANVSHELRTPLTALLGFIETLRGAARDDPVARERFLHIMEREAGRMNRLVSDLLSLSRVESQERQRPQDSADIPAILRSVVSSLAPIAEEAGSEITLNGAERDVWVPGDADQLAQVFSNLVENALKYGGPGARVEVSLTGPEPAPSLRSDAITVTVGDDGDGFDPIHIPRLTERFYRVDNHRSREMGGTGLGLAIVKHIVARHRGRLKIESAPGDGARFSIVLPAP
ncbi:MAG: ATP-binding protein [Pseudomonadota bacterium]